jgi:hypothetical protein
MKALLQQSSNQVISQKDCKIWVKVFSSPGGHLIPWVRSSWSVLFWRNLRTASTNMACTWLFWSLLPILVGILRWLPPPAFGHCITRPRISCKAVNDFSLEDPQQAIQRLWAAGLLSALSWWDTVADAIVCKERKDCSWTSIISLCCIQKVQGFETRQLRAQATKRRESRSHKIVLVFMLSSYSCPALRISSTTED